MTAESKNALVSGGVAALRTGTPALLAWILHELMMLNQKLDLLIQLAAQAHR